MMKKEFLEMTNNLKIGQIIKVVVKYLWKEKEEVIKGLYVGVNNGVNNAYIDLIPAYEEGNMNSTYHWTISLNCEYIKEVTKIRLPKEVSEQLKYMHKEMEKHQKLKKQLTELESKIKISSNNIEQTHQNVKKKYVELSNDVSESNLLQDMVSNLRKTFQQRNENTSLFVGFANRTSNNNEQIIEIEFGKITGAIYSKGLFDSNREFQGSDSEKLAERYCHHVLQPTSDYWKANIEKSVSLGDKGVLETSTIVQLTLSKKKITKAFIPELEMEILKWVKANL